MLVLVPGRADGPRGPPEDMPIGRAALRVEAEGIPVVFGDAVDGGVVRGLRAGAAGWEPVSMVVAAVYDRYPSQRLAARHAGLEAALAGVPMCNPESVVGLCRDKLACQRVLEGAGLPMPAVEADPVRFADALRAWGTGFLKPRFGAFGVGVRRVEAGDPLPAQVAGTVRGALQPAILQRAVRPPAGWAGVSVRVLCQRLPDGRWHLVTPVARRDRDDPVVNVHRGAQAEPAGDVLTGGTLEEVGERCLRVCEAVGGLRRGRNVVEIGVDLAVAHDGVPWVIEVNGRPRGRLEVLAEADPARFGEAHLEACARPLRAVWALRRVMGPGHPDPR